LYSDSTHSTTPSQFENLQTSPKAGINQPHTLLLLITVTLIAQSAYYKAKQSRATKFPYTTTTRGIGTEYAHKTFLTIIPQIKSTVIARKQSRKDHRKEDSRRLFEEPIPITVADPASKTAIKQRVLHGKIVLGCSSDKSLILKLVNPYNLASQPSAIIARPQSPQGYRTNHNHSLAEVPISFIIAKDPENKTIVKQSILHGDSTRSTTPRPLDNLHTSLRASINQPHILLLLITGTLILAKLLDDFHHFKKVRKLNRTTL
jgi:hypothetical protein